MTLAEGVDGRSGRKVGGRENTGVWGIRGLHVSMSVCSHIIHLPESPQGCLTAFGLETWLPHVAHEMLCVRPTSAFTLHPLPAPLSHHTPREACFSCHSEAFLPPA